jgi:transposase
MKQAPQSNSLRGKEYSPNVVRIAKLHMTLRSKTKVGPSKTVNEIKESLGIRSRSTIYNFLKRDNTKEGRLQRRRRKGARRLFTQEQEDIISGFIVLQSSVHKNTSSAVLRSFIREFFHKEVKSPWITKFAKRNHLSFRTAKSKVKATIQESDEISMEDFLHRVRAKKKAPHQIACLDKTSIYSQTVYPLQLGPLGRYVLVIKMPAKLVV